MYQSSYKGKQIDDTVTYVKDVLPNKLQDLFENIEEHSANISQEAIYRSQADSALDTKITTVEEIAKGANQALAFDAYQSLFQHILDNQNYWKTEVPIGNNIYIKKIDIPDLWLMYKDDDVVEYRLPESITDFEVVNSLNGEDGYFQYGSFRFAQLETQKVNLNSYATKQDISVKADKDELPTKVSDLENDLDLVDRDTMNGIADFVYDKLDEEKADKTDIISNISTAYGYDFSQRYNSEIRLAEVTSISFTFGNGEYMADYTSGLSFNSGATPTAIDYTDSGILNWVGTDCTTNDGLSIFQPSENTHYDIVFYFNGWQFIGLVNGFVPATGNEAV